MKQRQMRADKGQARKPQAQKRTHNWQVLLTDDENAVIDNYLKKEGIDKAFFMRKAMLKAVPKSFRILDLGKTPGEPQEAPLSPDPAPVVASSIEVETPEQPANPPITVASPIIVAEQAPELPVNASISEKQAPAPTKPKKATKGPSWLPPIPLKPKSKEELAAEMAATKKLLGIED
jgi:hypothetical protein